MSPGLDPGDLEVLIEVTPHPFFRRSGHDVECTIPVSFAAAVLGGRVRVPTLGGEISLRVPPHTQSGSVIRLRGHGFPRRFPGAYGDQLVRVSVLVPERLTPRARELVEQLAQEIADGPKPAHSPSWLERLRHWAS